MEILILPPSCRYMSAICISQSSSSRLKSKRKKNKSQPKRLHDHNTASSSSVSYPKTSPTPLLATQTATPQTRDQLLDQVLNDLQASIERGVTIDSAIFSSLLETCFQMQSLDHGIRVRCLIPPALVRNSVNLSSKLLRLYASCGLVEEAHCVFDEMPNRNKTAFAWNSLISGYAELGLHEDAMALYYQMEEEGVDPDQFTFPRVLKACAGLRSIKIGEAVHRHVVRSGFGNDPFVLNSLVHMYAKCGDIMRARRIFDKITHRDSISWNSMLTGYARHGLFAEALDVCRQMLPSEFDPDSVAISTILSGLSWPSDLGLEIHCWVLRRGLHENLSVANALISMYSGHSLNRARAIFNAMPERDVVSWNAIICAHRRDHRVLEIFRQMENSGVSPDGITFVSLLSAFANLGLVEGGRRLFTEMEERYKMKPRMEHYSCMVNLLGREGLVEEAYQLVSKRMPFEEGGQTVWGALLYACSLHGNVSVGEVAAERLFELEPDNAHNFQLMMKIYGNAGRMEEAEKVRRLMKDRGLESVVF